MTRGEKAKDPSWIREEWAVRLLTLLEQATPEQLTRFCRACRKRGPKFVILARVIEGEITVTQAEEEMLKLGE